LKKILFVVGEGIGNQIQTIPALIYCKNKFACEVDICNTIRTCADLTEIIFKGLAEKILKPSEVVRENYHGQVLTALLQNSPVSGLRVLNSRPKEGEISLSEIELNMKCIGEDFEDADFLEFGGAFDYIPEMKDVPDVLICNGYCKVNDAARNRWKAKSYPYYSQVAEDLSLAGLTVGSIGLKEEHVKGTIDFTELTLEQTIAAIKGAKLVLCNDTGIYHLANMVGTNNVVVFTFTNTLKNFDKRFHKHTTIIDRSAELACVPCQKRTWSPTDFWITNRNKCRWACRNISPKIISKACQKGC